MKLGALVCILFLLQVIAQYCSHTITVEIQVHGLLGDTLWYLADEAGNVALTRPNYGDIDGTLDNICAGSYDFMLICPNDALFSGDITIYVDDNMYFSRFVSSDYFSLDVDVKNNDIDGKDCYHKIQIHSDASWILQYDSETILMKKSQNTTNMRYGMACLGSYVLVVNHSDNYTTTPIFVSVDGNVIDLRNIDNDTYHFSIHGQEEHLLTTIVGYILCFVLLFLVLFLFLRCIRQNSVRNLLKAPAPAQHHDIDQTITHQLNHPKIFVGEEDEPLVKSQGKISPRYDEYGSASFRRISPSYEN